MIDVDLEELHRKSGKHVLELEENLHKLSQLIRSNFELRVFLEDSAIPQEKKLKLIGETLNNAPAIFNDFVKIIFSNKIEKRIIKISEGFTKLVSKNEGVVFAEAETPAPLSQEDKKKITGFLGGSVRIRENINPDLIGGIRMLCSDGRFFDGSISGSLNKLKESLINA